MGYLTDYYRLLAKANTKAADGFIVSDIPGMSNHKLGISASQLPMFFIYCQQTDKGPVLPDYSLNILGVQFDKICQLITDQQIILTNTYTIITLKSGSDEIIEYFLDVVYLMLNKLSRNFHKVELKVHIQSLIQLFTSLSSPPIKTAQGLWAELLIIEQSKNPAYLLGAWHRSNYDKFDFNDGKDKIEVKSTSQNRRIHTFGADQLTPNKSSCLLIASVYTIETSSGKSILDLSQNIENSIKDPVMIYQLKEKIGATLGSNFESAGEVFFDYRQAIDSCAFFRIEDIPKINPLHIPIQIQNIRFECDLTGIKPVRTTSLKSMLFESLWG